ncbi:hypothetical protein O3M35_007265 [Rhynocoris fuscipes]|uniref:Lipase domain-containing protein n=1 Tax=Rhynocoris fuscipes TaxID=488301 RepID=A0AAW1D8X2_9HEMI
MKLLLYFYCSFILICQTNLITVSGCIIGSLHESIKINISSGNCTYQINHPCDADDKIKFILFTGNSIDNGIELNVSNATNKKLPVSYDGSLPLKVIIHGYSGSEYVYNIIKAYLYKGGNNVLLVDWGPLSRKPCYCAATVNTWQVGRCASLVLHQLLPAKYVHIVGFSLGAHVAGIVSNYLNEQLGKKVDRITGLDPALPMYSATSALNKLDPTDAYFVDVIHTSVGTYGKIEACGHQDFYVNKHPTQPGCNPTTVICSHKRATELFAESINTKIGFWATRCSSILSYLLGSCSTFRSNEQQILMGEYTDKRYSGVFFLKTANSPPYALGKLENKLQLAKYKRKKFVNYI